MSDTKENKPKTIEDVVNDLTPKQTAFLHEWLKTGNGVQSALKTYDTESYKSASVIAHENLEKLRDPLQLIAEARGIDIGLLMDTLREGLQATKATNAAVLLTQDGKTMKAEEQGLIEVPDHDQRGKYFDRAVEFIGIKGEKQEQPAQATQVNVYNVSGEEGELKEQWTSFLKEQEDLPE